MLFDLEAGGVCTVDEALARPLFFNQQRQLALHRREAREHLRLFDAIGSCLATLGGEDAAKALAQRIRDLLAIANGDDDAADAPATLASDDTAGYMSTEALMKAGF